MGQTPCTGTMPNAGAGAGTGPQYRSVAYFVNWAIYARQHKPQDLPAKKLTHILYAFANVLPETGEVYLTDLWADQDIHFDGDSWNDSGKNLYGCLKQLNLLKLKNRSLKLLLSIGGWTYSANFSKPASTSVGRKKFADSALDLLLNYGFDGLDIDWEYPQAGAEAQNYVLLLQMIRETLDSYASTLSTKPRFLLTVACPAGPDYINNMDVSNMDRYLDFWNLMAYDFAGSFTKNTGHQANLFPTQINPASTPFSIQAAVDSYKQKGVSSSKIVLGMPLYGRAFENTDGLGKSYSGVGEGSWEPGIYDYKVLPLAGSKDGYDQVAHASYCYDPTKRKLVSYDSVASSRAKAKWIKSQNLGGAMWWESSGDRCDQSSLIQTVTQELGQLESSQNCLEYPKSRFDNIKNITPK
ncbi:Endochitinase B1 [Erysiphe neolycopersici]|uniref:chitinase n=1 Tax=Erysiphe neolycopersici TaxID=212602 RepID=A0A420I0Q1_9PEZI|nr:Endochitinase B1 [Erysiphe neolycopersici]